MINSSSSLSALTQQPADALLALIALHGDDARIDKIDLGVGVYRDDGGRTPIMRAVKAAERLLLETQTSKSYLGAEGDPAFVAALAPIVLGHALMDGGSFVGIQTPGGSGALRLGAELYARAHPDARIWIGTPTWPNHAPIFMEAGFRIASHPFYDATSATMDFAGMVAALDMAYPGDLLLLHGCCHNPTGLQFSDAQWHELAAFCRQRRLIPFIDLAYQGLADGLIEDVRGMRAMLAQVPNALLAYSCDKNFGLYRERVGALWLHEHEMKVRDVAWQNMLVLARCLWSMPPDHGAAIVRTILENPTLAIGWRAELVEMRDRLNAVRAALAGALPSLAVIGSQRGMFALLPFTPAEVVALRKEHAIYMAGSGRMNIAGLSLADVDRFAAAIAPVLARHRHSGS